MDIKKLKTFYHHELMDTIDFWLKSDLIDKQYGGFITSVDQKGKKYNDDKSVWFQGRTLWSFAKLCNTYGVNKEWENAAHSGAKFIQKKCIDKDGRMFFVVTRDGKPLRKRRYYFSESFLVVGFAEYYLLTKNPHNLELAEKYFDLMYQIYKKPESDPFKITPKENSRVRNIHSNANPMVLVSAAQTLRRISKRKTYYDRIIKDIVNDMITLHYKKSNNCVLENVLINGEIIDNPTGRTINPGHCIENSWFLMNYANKTKDKALLKKALNIFNWSFEIGWDKEYGGIYYFRDLYNRPCEQLEFDMKLWWVHCEALIASLAAYKLTNDRKYLSQFQLVHNYVFTHFKDKKYGEWFGYLHRDGTVSHTQKGSMWKGPYHLIRCYILIESILDSIINKKELPDLL
ncbi:MAG: AGE family epimerase/isomerase [Bacilli bacterium]|nr:AGE family epimerase/isomerase [Bacilli bacterium]